MENILAMVLPLLIAFLGAMFGAYFAVVKSKKERLWTERFEALRSVVKSAELICYDSEVSTLEDYGLRVMSAAEREKLSHSMLESKHELRESMSLLKLLFKPKVIQSMLDAYDDVNDAILKLSNHRPDEYRPDYFHDIRGAAMVLVNETTGLAARKCL
tara:strand:+ start:1266 stop:1739 length:474 start_codon:yes stop_codon:yes gene_type:complete